jgi:predicted anti-sigma-YlaC factor YlaD
MNNRSPSDDGDPASDFGMTADEVNCREFVELITDYFEGALSARTLAHVEEHLVLCDWCRTYREQMRATIESLRHLEDRSVREPGESLLAALRSKAAGR